MEYVNELAEKVKKNFFGLDFNMQLRVLYVYQQFLEESNQFLNNYFKQTYSKYIERISIITLFKSNFELLNTEGKKFIRTNLINQLNSVGYNGKTDIEKYGLTKDELLTKYCTFFGKPKNVDELISSFSPDRLEDEFMERYITMFSSLPIEVKNDIVMKFCYYNAIVDTGFFSDYMYPIAMKDEFNEEMKVLLLDYYKEYEKMTPDRRMEYIYDIVTKQMPRAFKHMDSINSNDINKVKSLTPITG